MKEDCELPEIDINEITLYPEMDKNIANILMIRNHDIVSMYAAKLIKKYQAARCKTCKYQDEYSDCHNPKLTDSLPDNPEMETDTSDMLVYSLEGGGSFHVGGKFGCVHYAGKEKSC